MSDQDFDRGYVIACCNLENLHGESDLAWDVLAELGVSRADIRRMDLCEYDMRALKRIEKNGRSGSPYADGRKRPRRAKA